jgi:hypothetical protein
LRTVKKKQNIEHIHSKKQTEERIGAVDARALIENGAKKTLFQFFEILKFLAHWELGPFELVACL